MEARCRALALKVEGRGGSQGMYVRLEIEEVRIQTLPGVAGKATALLIVWFYCEINLEL